MAVAQKKVANFIATADPMVHIVFVSIYYLMWQSGSKDTILLKRL